MRPQCQYVYLRSPYYLWQGKIQYLLQELCCKLKRSGRREQFLALGKNVGALNAEECEPPSSSRNAHAADTCIPCVLSRSAMSCGSNGTCIRNFPIPDVKNNIMCSFIAGFSLFIVFKRILQNCKVTSH